LALPVLREFKAFRVFRELPVLPVHKAI